MFRVDSRIYELNDIIYPQTTYSRNLSEEKQEMEDALNNYRLPGIPERKNCLFLFDSLLNAIKFYLRYGGNIYWVKPCRIYHRGDMNKLDNILDVFRLTDKEDIRIPMVNEYWKPGTHTYMPCYEYLVPSAIVKDILLSNDNLEDVKSELENCRSIEYAPTYKILLERIARD